MGVKYKLIDVSKHNGDIDFSKVKADGIQGVIIRAGYGSSTVDKCFHNNIKNAIENGLHVGIYWFGYAYTVSQAEKEANFCLKTIEPYKGKIDFPIFYDWEYDSYNYAKKQGVTVSKQLCSDMTAKFCDVIENHGYFAGFYANIDYLNRFYTDEIKKRYTLWVAQWSTKCSYTGNYGIWQYGAETNKIDSKKVSGVPSATVDKNFCYIDYPKIIQSKGFNGYQGQAQVDISNKDISLTDEQIKALKNHISNLEDNIELLSNIKKKLQ